MAKAKIESGRSFDHALIEATEAFSFDLTGVEVVMTRGRLRKLRQEGAVVYHDGKPHTHPLDLPIVLAVEADAVGQDEIMARVAGGEQ